MTLYRISSAARRTAAQAFSGEGALHGSGRWNSAGTRLVYTSSSVALACLETLVHLRPPRRLIERWLFTIEVPDRWVEALPDTPGGWDSEPANATSRTVGDHWIKEERSVALLVPSVIISLEQNALINPRHPRFRIDWVQGPVRFRYDPRLE